MERGAQPASATPGLPRRRLAALAALCAVALAGAGLALRRELGPGASLRVRSVAFRGMARATADELAALSPVKPGDPFLAADLPAMERALARHPWVRRAVVHRRWPPALAVDITERRAEAIVDLGGLYLVDGDGAPFKRAAPRDGLDLPVVTGLSRADYVAHREVVEPLLGGALALALAWREGGRDEVARLSEIHVDPGDGTTLYVGDDGVQVRLGAGDLPQKLARLDQVLAALRAEGRTAEVLRLDNRLHPAWVTVRLAAGPRGAGP